MTGIDLRSVVTTEACRKSNQPQLNSASKIPSQLLYAHKVGVGATTLPASAQSLVGNADTEATVGFSEDEHWHCTGRGARAMKLFAKLSSRYFLTAAFSSADMA